MQNLEAAFLSIGLKFRRDATSAEVQLLRCLRLAQAQHELQLSVNLSSSASLRRRRSDEKPKDNQTQRHEDTKSYAAEMKTQRFPGQKLCVFTPWGAT